MAIDSRAAKSSAKTIEKKKILLVIDDPESDWDKDLINAENNSVEHNLLTLGFSAEQILLKDNNLLQKRRQTVKIIDTTDISRIAEKEAREYYLKLVKDLPKK